MRPLHLDYQARKPRSPPAMLCLVAGVIALAVSLWRFEQLRQERATWDAELAIAQARLERQATPRRTQGAPSAEETAGANAVVRRLAFPWPELFGAVEAAAGNDVALVGIEPDPAKGMVTLTAESKTAREMLQYVKRLQRTAFLADAVLLKHEVQADSPDKAVRFTVQGTWKDSQ
jgi:hypothetical protein